MNLYPSAPETVRQLKSRWPEVTAREAEVRVVLQVCFSRFCQMHQKVRLQLPNVPRTPGRFGSGRGAVSRAGVKAAGGWSPGVQGGLGRPLQSDTPCAHAHLRATVRPQERGVLCEGPVSVVQSWGLSLIHI